jgi:hypothetical protein
MCSRASGRGSLHPQISRLRSMTLRIASHGCDGQAGGRFGLPGRWVRHTPDRRFFLGLLLLGDGVWARKADVSTKMSHSIRSPNQAVRQHLCFLAGFHGPPESHPSLTLAMRNLFQLDVIPNKLMQLLSFGESCEDGDRQTGVNDLIGRNYSNRRFYRTMHFVPIGEKICKTRHQVSPSVKVC